MASLALLAFMAGLLFAENKWFPYLTIEDAQKTLRSVIVQLFPPLAPFQFVDFSGGKVGDVARNRIIVRAAAPEAANNEHFLMSGGIDKYLEYCPAPGCIAAEFARTGALVHAYPYRPDQFDAHKIVSLPYEQVPF
ncbi:MAG TPA: hypothetical protein VNF04_10015, partial [Stellaceae bacterium]|nr:hypothetical protein [Stellaceae bacterium]